jgi:membrane protein DedA with SNARE-associated domain
MAKFIKYLLVWYMSGINYISITCLMAVESSFLPLPAEAVIPPAAYKAANGELNIILVVLFSVAGSVLGALFNYTISRYLGRAIIYKLSETKVAQLLMVDKPAIEKAENYFIKFGNISTFIGRLIPVIRHLISIPAGISRMKLKDFIIFTAMGSLLSSTALSILGYFIYTRKELLNKYCNELSYGFIAFCVLIIVYIFLRPSLFPKAVK